MIVFTAARGIFRQTKLQLLDTTPKCIDFEIHIFVESLSVSSSETRKGHR